MEVIKGEKGLTETFQAPFPKTAKCECGGEARIAFVAAEEQGEDEYVCNLHENEGKGGFWPHDACAVAVYLCRECLKPVALFNQR